MPLRRIGEMTMKYNCKWCGQPVNITQSEKAKTGLKNLTDHEDECFKKRNPNFGKIFEIVHKRDDNPEVPDKFDMSGIIAYLHKFLGRIPTEDECLRFHMFLLSPTKPTKTECEDFVKILKQVGK